MKNNNKRKNMNNFKKVGLTALAGSLAAVSAHAAEMGVSGATVLTYTSKDSTEVTGNPMGMKTNLSFTASGDVNGYTVSYMQTSADQFAGMSSARLSVDMGDMGVLAFDQGSGSGLATIDDKTPTANEEIWDGLDASASTADNNGLVGAAGSSGVINYIKSYEGIKLNAAYRAGSAASNADGASSGVGEGAWDFALTTDGTSIGIDGIAVGVGYGKASLGDSGTGSGDEKHSTAFVNYSIGMITAGYQLSDISMPGNAGVDEATDAWGIALNINENLSISYGEREVEYNNPTSANVTESGDGIAVAYTMGSMKIAGNRNEVSDNDNATGGAAKDAMTEVAVSFAF